MILKIEIEEDFERTGYNAGISPQTIYATVYSASVTAGRIEYFLGSIVIDSEDFTCGQNAITTVYKNGDCRLSFEAELEGMMTGLDLPCKISEVQNFPSLFDVM